MIKTFTPTYGFGRANRASEDTSIRLSAVLGAAIVLIALMTVAAFVGVPADPPEVNVMLVGP